MEIIVLRIVDGLLILEQANNKSNNRIFEYKGERLTMSQLVKKYGKCSLSLFDQRLREGWTDLEALLSAPGTYKRNTQNGKDKRQ